MFPTKMTPSAGNRGTDVFTLANPIAARLAQVRPQVEDLNLSLLARAWTPSLLARSGCSFSVVEIHFACSRRARFRAELFPPNPSDEPASALLERLKWKRT